MAKRRIIWTDHTGTTRLGTDLKTARAYLSRSYSGHEKREQIVASVRFDSQAKAAA